MPYRNTSIALIAIFASVCCLAAWLPPPGEPRLHYEVPIPLGTPRRITTTDGTVQDARALYFQRHREGWHQRVLEFVRPVRSTLPSVYGVCDPDLDAPFDCRTQEEVWAYIAGKQDCRRALNDLIVRYGAERVREALSHAILREAQPSHDRIDRPHGVGVRMLGEPSESMRR